MIVVDINEKLVAASPSCSNSILRHAGVTLQGQRQPQSARRSLVQKDVKGRATLSEAPLAFEYS